MVWCGDTHAGTRALARERYRALGVRRLIHERVAILQGMTGLLLYRAKISATSCASSGRHAPGGNAPSVSPPTETRCNVCT